MLLAAWTQEPPPEWVVFTSVVAVEQSHELVPAEFWDGLRNRSRAGQLRVGAVGPSTEAALRRLGIEPDLTGQHGAAELAEQVRASTEAPIVLHPCARRARPELADGITRDAPDSAPGSVRAVPVYEVREAESVNLDSVLEPPADLLVFASPSAAEILWRRSPPQLRSQWLGLPLLSLGAATSETLRSFGSATIYEASSNTLQAVLDAAERALSRM